MNLRENSIKRTKLEWNAAKISNQYFDLFKRN